MGHSNNPYRMQLALEMILGANLLAPLFKSKNSAHLMDNTGRTKGITPSNKS